MADPLEPENELEELIPELLRTDNIPKARHCVDFDSDSASRKREDEGEPS